MNTRGYTHGKCPACGSLLAKHLGDGRFRCKGMGCTAEFKGTRKRRNQLGHNRARRSKRRDEDFGALAEVVRGLPCCVVGCGSRRATDPHHVRTRGAGGSSWGVDEDGRLVGNIVPLCREHHRMLSAGHETFEREQGPFVLRTPHGEIYENTLRDTAIAAGAYAAEHCGVNPLTNSRRGQ